MDLAGERRQRAVDGLALALRPGAVGHPLLGVHAQHDGGIEHAIGERFDRAHLPAR